MDYQQPSNSNVRRCLICGVQTASCHLGVDACRACTVFYRRAKGRKLYACRSNTRRCATNAESGIACKRCRYDRFERVLKESGATEPMSNRVEKLESQSESSPSNVASEATAPSPALIHSTLEQILKPEATVAPTIASQHQLDGPTINSAFKPVSPSTPETERPLITSCKLYHKLLCSMRRTCELAGRPNAPHPLQMNDTDYPIVPATFGLLNASTKIALAAILEFATNMFPEFAAFSKEEKWTLAVSFFYSYQAIDSCYRAENAFPDNIDRSFGCYTCYLSEDIMENFFDDCPNECTNIEDAKKFMIDIMKKLVRPGRLAVRRAHPDNEELHAVLVILFWFTEGRQLRDEIVQLGERYRAAVLQELHAYYREELAMDDYAARVGELFMLILHFERNKDIREHFEICRMMGVFTDDTFVYQLQKK